MYFYGHVSSNKPDNSHRKDAKRAGSWNAVAIDVLKREHSTTSVPSLQPLPNRHPIAIDNCLDTISKPTKISTVGLDDHVTVPTSVHVNRYWMQNRLFSHNLRGRTNQPTSKVKYKPLKLLHPYSYLFRK